MKRKITFAPAVALMLVTSVSPVMSDGPLHVVVDRAQPRAAPIS